MTDLLYDARAKIVGALWNRFQRECQEAAVIASSFDGIALDHFALIDLPGPHTGIEVLRRLFETVGFVKRGDGYLADKQNRFLWMAEEGVESKLAEAALPQIVVADFRAESCSPTVKKILEKHVENAPPVPFGAIEALAQSCRRGERGSVDALVALFLAQMSASLYGTPSSQDVRALLRENDLIGWSLLFGREVNHFGLGVHLCPGFSSLAEFNRAFESKIKLPLNRVGGKTIHGTPAQGLEQSATVHGPKSFRWRDGSIDLPNKFVEFVWRHAKNPETAPRYWRDYSTGFFAANANKIVESLRAQRGAGAGALVGPGEPGLWTSLSYLGKKSGSRAWYG